MLGKSNTHNLSADTDDITLDENELCKKISKPSIDQFPKKHSESHHNIMEEEV